jgi:hypothetical protein
MKASPCSRPIARTLANLGVATTEIDFVPNGRFIYRHNTDGTTDSICLSCYLTAATGLTPDELTLQELSHLTDCVGNDYAHGVISTSQQATGSR